MTEKNIANFGSAVAVGLMALSLPSWSADVDAAPLAGLAPYERPAGAPAVKSVNRTPEQTAKVTTGIDKPMPPGIEWLKDQGAWYTPFERPGMVGYYDVRGWHGATGGENTAAERAGKQFRATYSPLHFKPAIDTAKDEDCLACHREVLEDRVRGASPAGVKTAYAKAWYQAQAETYVGEQETFHRRHLVTDFAKSVMNLKCNTCHQGHDPREEAQAIPSRTSSAGSELAFTLRKQVNPETTCLKCHGQMNWPVMGLPAAWSESKAMFQNNCLLCHVAIRTARHQVNYLNAAKIEELGAKSGDTCFGCHGGRAWYRISYPYARTAWDGMAPEVPEWAKKRPTRSEARFLVAK